MAGLGDLKLNETFTDINPDELPEELKGTYKNMQSHFTKRTQEVVDAKKKYDDGINVMSEEKSALEKELESLKEQNQSLQASLSTKSDDDILSFLSDIDGDKTNTNPQQDDKRVIELTKQVSTLTEKLGDLEGALEEKTSKALKVIQYERDLADVADEHHDLFGEKLDRKKLIDFAIEKQKPDLHEAYEAFVRDDVIEKKATERADVLLKERLEKDESFGAGVGGETPMIFARDEKAPKTFGEATKQVLKEIRTKL